MVLSGLTGCGASRRPNVQLDRNVQRPDHAVVLITVDGLAADEFDELLAAGKLPNIRANLIDRGVRVRRAVASQPTITYANLTTILTGCYSGRHGILGNEWFDRNELLFRDYTTTATYRLVDGDYATPTLFDHLAPARSVSIQCASRRGVSRTIDNWASSGIRWFFGCFADVDRLIPLRMELIAQDANRWGAWPTLIHAYFPAVDEVGHRHGPDSPQYRQAVVNVDRQIGRLVQAVRDAGMVDRTFWVLTSDHGQVPSAPDRFLDVAGLLRRSGFTVESRAGAVAFWEEHHRHYAKIDAVVVTGGDRRATIHLRGSGGWRQRPAFAQVRALLDLACGSEAGPWTRPQIGLALAARRDPDTGEQTIEVYSPRGHSRLRRRHVDSRAEYGYEVITTDALGGGVPAGWHDAEAWLALTAETQYPDLVVPLVELFDSARAGDVMLVAADDWDFARGNRGGHGGVAVGDALIPMVFAGPGLPAGGGIDHARLVDVAPTVLGLLRPTLAVTPINRFDGLDRSEQLRNAR